MKKSDLRNIIKEEIKSILEAEDPINISLKKAMGFEKPEGGEGNRIGLPLEKLPNYKKLESGGTIKLPSIDDANSSNLISSIDDAKEWVNNFIKKWGIDNGNTVRFRNIEGGLEVTNSKKYNDWKKDAKKQIASFYKSLKYKGD